MLENMFEQQRQFMCILQKYRNFPIFPVDIVSKAGQKFLKEITHECMHELFEANQKLKNSKNHRITNITEFNREDYIEELVDVLHYFFEIIILSGVSIDELYLAYMKKGEINKKRIESNY